VHPRSVLRALLLGNGVVVALTLTLVVAAVLAGIGLFLELTGARMTVVAAHQQTLIASQALSAPEEVRGPADADDGGPEMTADPHADPIEVHPGSAEGAPGPGSSEGGASAPLAGGMPAAGAEAAAEAAPSPEARPGPRKVEAAGPGPAPRPSPEAVAEVAPAAAPAPAAARVKPEPGPRGPPRASADVPIVMYHHIGPLPPNPDVFRKDLTVSADLFEQTISRLTDQQVETVTMADLLEHFAGGPELPKRAAILTFDDGYDDAYDYAFPLLKQYGMVGTFFIITDFVGRPGYLTWDQIQEMAEAGMEIEAHSLTHPDFTLINAAELRRQLTQSKAALEDHLGQPVRFMAYPAGKYNAAVMAATRAAGYAAAVTVIHGTHHVPSQDFELRRVRAHGADTVAGIVSRMTPVSWRQ